MVRSKVEECNQCSSEEEWIDSSWGNKQR